MGGKSEYTFFQRGHIDRQKIHEKCSALLIIKDLQIKSTMSYPLTPVRMTTSKSTQITNVGKDVEKRELSYTVGSDANCCSPCRKQHGGFPKG